MAQAAEAAVRQGLNELCITDHVDTLYWDDFRPRWDFDWDEARRQFREAQALGAGFAICYVHAPLEELCRRGVGRRSVRL